MSNKVSYIQLLKEAVTEYDAKAMDYKGPLTEPILTFSGEGELQTQKDASSILERYYFNEKKEKLVEQEIGPDNPVKADDEADAEDPNEIVTGEEADNVNITMDDFEDEILDEGDDVEMKEDVDLEGLEEDLELEDLELALEDPSDADLVANDEPFDPEDKNVDIEGAEDKPLDAEKAAAINNEMISLENTIIEKLIQEMEDETESEAGNEEAGTGAASEKEVNKVLEDDFDLLEAELDAAADEGGEEKEKDLDVDKEMGSDDEEKSVKAECQKEWNMGMGPIQQSKAKEELNENFDIFTEQIEGENEEDKEKEEKDKAEEEKGVEEDFDIDLLEASLEEDLELEGDGMEEVDKD